MVKYMTTIFKILEALNMIVGHVVYVMEVVERIVFVLFGIMVHYKYRFYTGR